MADLLFKDFSRNTSKFKYFSSLCAPLYAIRNKSGALHVLVPLANDFNRTNILFSLKAFQADRHNI